MRWVVVALFASGCSSILGIEDFKVGDAGTTDSDAAETGYCLGPADWRVCLDEEPMDALPITSGPSLNTSTSGNCAPPPPSWKAAGQPDACFLVGRTVTFDSTMLHITGMKPLVVVASDSITVNQHIDVSSRQAIAGVSATGAGAHPMACVAPQAAIGSQTGGGGGGAGGTFMTAGGGGGTSTGGLSGGTPGAPLAQPPMRLRGGCEGGVGGNGNGAGGTPGRGGGAVYLVAKDEIVINGFINASGSGGGGGGSTAGGGGGGSGGMIVLHAMTIRGNGGVLMANGGGGGGGALGNQSSPGGDPMPSNPSTPAPGGGGVVGGIGYAGTRAAGKGDNGSPSNASGGGAGGGGAGYIRANVAVTGITASPAIDIVN